MVIWQSHYICKCICYRQYFIKTPQIESQCCLIGWLLKTKSQNPVYSGIHTYQQFDNSNTGILVTMATRTFFVLFLDICFLYALKNPLKYFIHNRYICARTRKYVSVFTLKKGKNALFPYMVIRKSH